MPASPGPLTADGAERSKILLNFPSFCTFHAGTGYGVCAYVCFGWGVAPHDRGGGEGSAIGQKPT
jgi:hypothetical protein